MRIHTPYRPNRRVCMCIFAKKMKHSVVCSYKKYLCKRFTVILECCMCSVLVSIESNSL